MVRLFASAAPSVSIELGAAVSFALAAIVVLLGIIAWFLRREIKNNASCRSAPPRATRSGRRPADGIRIGPAA